MTSPEERRNLIAQWAFDTRNILGRFHLWLEDVEETWLGGDPGRAISFAGAQLERGFIMTSAVTAVGTRLFGRYGEARGMVPKEANAIKKDADAASAYAMSEGLWYLTRNLPENHALMVSLGEGLMPKGGETPDMGSNPLLGFGRIYARPSVAKALERLVHRLINDRTYLWDDFWADTQSMGMTVWGAAIDTLENTSRFARGNDSGPMSVLHVFDQPLQVSRPYEGYVGNLVLPRAVVEKAAERSVLLDYLAPRSLVMESLKAVWPDLAPGNVHVWTLGGKNRTGRIGKLWDEWRACGAHVLEDGWMLPTGLPAFTESGTYAPTYRIGEYRDASGARHVFLADGYAASAEAIQAASLDPVRSNATSMCLFTSRFDQSYEKEHRIAGLDPEAKDFVERLTAELGRPAEDREVSTYSRVLGEARQAGMPVGRRTVTIDDFFPRKKWQVLALNGYMLPDPYTGAPGVEVVRNGSYRVVTRASSTRGEVEVSLTLRLKESFEGSRLVFSPLLDRFYRGQDYRTRAVKVSDSGRIRNELQTLASEALEYFGDNCIRIRFDRIDPAVLAPDKQKFIRDVLRWYKEHHPIWFEWLELTDPGAGI